MSQLLNAEVNSDGYPKLQVVHVRAGFLLGNSLVRPFVLDTKSYVSFLF